VGERPLGAARRWRISRALPEWLEAQRLPSRDHGGRFWQERYEDVNAFEHHLDRNGTKIVKFFLHVSKAVRRAPASSATSKGSATRRRASERREPGPAQASTEPATGGTVRPHSRPASISSASLTAPPMPVGLVTARLA
jgi:Polyphosphate kinase 2 (PPK2)